MKILKVYEGNTKKKTQIQNTKNKRHNFKRGENELQKYLRRRQKLNKKIHFPTCCSYLKWRINSFITSNLHFVYNSDE